MDLNKNVKDEAFISFLDSYIAKVDMLMALSERKPDAFSKIKVNNMALIRETAVYIKNNYHEIDKSELRTLVEDFDYPMSKWI